MPANSDPAPDDAAPPAPAPGDAPPAPAPADAAPPAPAPGDAPPAGDAAPGTCEASITLDGDLHARPAGQLSVAAAGFASAVRLSVSGRDADVDAKSVLSVMQLGASRGQCVTVRADGPDARAAVDALIAILTAATAAE